MAKFFIFGSRPSHRKLYRILKKVLPSAIILKQTNNNKNYLYSDLPTKKSLFKCTTRLASPEYDQRFRFHSINLSWLFKVAIYLSTIIVNYKGTTKKQFIFWKLQVACMVSVWSSIITVTHYQIEVRDICSGAADFCKEQPYLARFKVTMRQSV